jgi:HlyD family secretion protein
MTSYAFDNTYKPEDSFSVRGQLLIALFTAMILVVAVMGWGMHAQLNAAVIGPGVIKVDREIKAVQHGEGGVLTEIIAEPGATVVQGQPLARLDTIELEANLEILKRQKLDLTARSARLVAMRDGLEALPMSITDSELTKDTEAMFAAETLLYERELKKMFSDIETLELRRMKIEHETSALDARLAALESELVLSTTALERAQTLAEKGTVSPAQVEKVQLDFVRLEGEKSELLSRREANLAAVNEITFEIEKILGTSAYEAHMQLREIEPRILQLQSEIEMAEVRLSRSVIRAPVDGIVNEMAINTLGQVISPGETVATIVPADAELIIEFKITPTDVDQVKVGQEARLRFTAFNQRTTPEFLGSVSHVSPASQIDEKTGMEYYISRAELKNLKGGNLLGDLKPGMPVEVYIQTIARTPVDYVIQPVLDSFNRAMIEE